MKRLLLFLVILVISGCSATGPQFRPETSIENDYALVYLYRPSMLKGGGITPPVFIDNQELFDLPNNGYAVLKLTEGKHVIETREDGNFLLTDAVGKAEIIVEKNTVYYVKWLPFLADFGVVPLGTPIAYGYFEGSFYPMSKDIALKEIKECKKVYPEI